MLRRGGLLALLATTLAGCGGYTSNAPSATVTSVTIAGAGSLSAVGQTSQLTLTATLTSGAPQTVTSQAAWQSSNTAVATVSAAGVVTAQGYGGASIKASYQGASTEFAVVVTIAGTWVASNPDGSVVTWSLGQSQGLVSGTFGIAPVVPGNSLSTATVSGTVGGSTLTWTMTGVIGAAIGHPECVGLALIVTGIAQVQSGGTSMNATIQGTQGVCGSGLPPSLSPGTAIAFARQ